MKYWNKGVVVVRRVKKKKKKKKEKETGAPAAYYYHQRKGYESPLILQGPMSINPTCRARARVRMII